MNIPSLLTPKAAVAYISDTDTIRQALEKMNHHGYTAIPVITDEGKYYGTISEGDFLWYIVAGEGGEEIKRTDIKTVEHATVRDLVDVNKYRPVYVTASEDELIEMAMQQSFLPVVDDSGSFIGIVTRQAIIRNFAREREKTPVEIA